MSAALFVYGLLKPGFRLHHLVAPFMVGAEPAVVRGRLYDARGVRGESEARRRSTNTDRSKTTAADPPTRGVPAAIFDADGEIEGVVLWLDPARLDEALALLDDVEDEGDVYRRVTISVRATSGEMRAMAYEYLRPLDGLEPVGSLWPLES